MPIEEIRIPGAKKITKEMYDDFKKILDKYHVKHSDNFRALNAAMFKAIAAIFLGVKGRELEAVELVRQYVAEELEERNRTP